MGVLSQYFSFQSPMFLSQVLAPNISKGTVKKLDHSMGRKIYWGSNFVTSTAIWGGGLLWTYKSILPEHWRPQDRKITLMLTRVCTESWKFHFPPESFDGCSPGAWRGGAHCCFVSVVTWALQVTAVGLLASGFPFTGFSALTPRENNRARPDKH